MSFTTDHNIRLEGQNSKDILPKNTTKQNYLEYVKQELQHSVNIIQVCQLYPEIILSGYTSGKNILTTCPICGHHDCFRIVPGENRWQCQSTGHTGLKGSDVIHLVQLMAHVKFQKALHILAEHFRPDLLEYFNENGNRKHLVDPEIYRSVDDYWKQRGITSLPASVKIKKDVVFYLTYVTFEETELFQYARTDNIKKRLVKTGSLQHELYIPLPWDEYKQSDELCPEFDVLYLVEGIPDALTYLTVNQKAIAAFNVGSVKRDLFQQELKIFLEYTTPKKIIVIPDPDGFRVWKDTLIPLLEDYQIEFVDLSLWLTEYTKIDSNSLFQNLRCNPYRFRQAITWIRQNSGVFQQDIGKDPIIKRWEDKNLGYFKTVTEKPKDGAEVKTEKRLTNFLMFFRHFFRDAESQEGKVKVTFLYDWNPKHRVTKTVDSKVLGDSKKFKELITSVKHTLFFTDLIGINFFEDRNYQHRQEIIGFEKFGHINITDDLVLFKNVAIYKGKVYYADHADLITVNDVCYQTLAQNAPALTLYADNSINIQLIETLYNAYGLNGVLSLAFDLASIRMKPIIDRIRSHPNKFCVGEPGVGKSTLEHAKNLLFGITQSLTCKDTRASLERITNTRQFLPATLNEFKLEHIDAADFLEKAYDRQIKNKAFTDNTNRTKENSLNAIISVTSNHIPPPSTALFRRNAYLRFQKQNFCKEHLTKLQALVKQSNIVLKVYTLKIGIEKLHEEARQVIENVNQDATIVNNYAPFLIGLTILNKLDIIGNKKLQNFKDEFLNETLPDTLSNISEESYADSFLKDLHSKSLQVKRETCVERDANLYEYETEINPGMHYVIRQNRLILDLRACVDIVNRYRNGNKFDKGVLEQALKDSSYFYSQPTQTKIDGKPRYKAIQLDCVRIQEELGLTFRENIQERPENILLDEKKEEETELYKEPENISENKDAWYSSD